MNKEKLFEKEITLGYLTAMIAKAREKGETMQANLPDPNIKVTPSMMRRAIDKALALETADGRGRTRRVFSTKKKWLAVYRVMQYFGIVDGYIQYQRAVNYIMNKVYPKGVPMPEAMMKIMPNTNALSVAGGESGLNKPLEEWLSSKYDYRLGDYLPIARCMVESISEEMLDYPPKA